MFSTYVFPTLPGRHAFKNYDFLLHCCEEISFCMSPFTVQARLHRLKEISPTLHPLQLPGVFHFPWWCFTPTTFPIRLTPFRHHADVWNVWEVCAGGTGLGVGHHGALHHCQNSCACTLGFHFYILHSPWLNILIFILEDSLNIIFEELIGKMRRILKLERIRTEWETCSVS